MYEYFPSGSVLWFKIGARVILDFEDECECTVDSEIVLNVHRQI